MPGPFFARIAPDPPEGVSVFAHAQMQEFLQRQSQLRRGEN
jgi:hypothetical protein